MCLRLPVVVIVLIVLLDTSNASTCCESLGYFAVKGERWRYLSVGGSEKYISLYWGSDPAHAASALFKVILQCAHGYQKVRLKQGPHSLIELAATVKFTSSGEYEDAILGLSTGWEPGLEPFKEPKAGATSGLGAPRLEDITANKVPARLRLHVHSPSKFRSREQCKNITQWSFYTHAEALRSCGFTNCDPRDDKAVVYIIQDSSNRTTELARILKERAKAFQLLFQFTELDRKTFFQKLHITDNESFLFIDYDMWASRYYISPVQEPPCLPDKESACIPELDTAIDIRVTDTFLLAEHASQLFQLANIFYPSVESLIFILQQNATGKMIEEAACDWISSNNETVYQKWVKTYEANKKRHEIAVFFSATGTDVRKYNKLLTLLSTVVYGLTKSNGYIVLRTYFREYFNTSFIKDELNYYMQHGVRQRLVGAVVGGDNNMTSVATAFDKSGFPVLLYDLTTADVDSTESVWLATGRSVELAIAMKYFIRKNNWTRVAILSDSTYVAKQFLEDLHICTADLRNANKLAIRDHPLERITSIDAKNVLHKLQTENAHIIIVNTYSQHAFTILKAAIELNMNDRREFAWIVREWAEHNKILNITHFTMSFCCPSDNNISSSNTRRKFFNIMNKLWPGRKWPRSAAALVDAVLIMAKGFEDVLLKHPQAREDTHSTQAIRKFGQSLIDLSPIEAFTQDVVYKKHSLAETILYLDEWQNGNFTSLERWRVNANAKIVEVENIYREAYFKDSPPHDGTSRCLFLTGDLYLPTCNDVFWIIAIVFIIVAPLSMVFVYRTIHRHLKNIQMKILSDLMAQRKQRAATLASYLVDRKALKPRRELGAGRFGCVMLADLLIPGSKTQVVAAKELRDHQNESEILREACILASLKHENIIRLVGVCIDNEPTLVLMEVAFFGDLLHYLEDRRYLAEGVASDSISVIDQDYEEAAHVSAKELTRLAREAASALAYLALRGVIHRDLRASNCLVDAKRSLKLADFGLARETKATSLDGGGEYACRRRGLFPVLWMAPESLNHGIFSTASDVYSLGVLLFELVTLGARPYGRISPLRVMRFVSSGGKPSMPRDATPQTIALAQLCWQREPEKRPPAAEVVAYLAEHQYALSPAFDYEDDQPTDVDSGYGESSSTEILLPE